MCLAAQQLDLRQGTPSASVEIKAAEIKAAGKKKKKKTISLVSRRGRMHVTPHPRERERETATCGREGIYLPQPPREHNGLPTRPRDAQACEDNAAQSIG